MATKDYNIAEIMKTYNIPESKSSLLSDLLNISSDLGLPGSLVVHMLEKESSFGLFDNPSQIRPIAWEDVKKVYGDKFSQEELSLLEDYFTYENNKIKQYTLPKRAGGLGLSYAEARQKAINEYFTALPEITKNQLNNSLAKAGVLYLNDLYKKTGNDPVKTLAAYRIGSSNVDKLEDVMDDPRVYSYITGYRDKMLTIDKNKEGLNNILSDYKVFQRTIGMPEDQIDGLIGNQTKQWFKDWVAKNIPDANPDDIVNQMFVPLKGDKGLYKLNISEDSPVYSKLYNTAQSFYSFPEEQKVAETQVSEVQLPDTSDIPTVEEFTQQVEQDISEQLTETPVAQDLTTEAVNTTAPFLEIDEEYRATFPKAFVNGLLFNRDIFDPNKFDPDVDPSLINLAKFSGQLANDFTTMLLSGGAVQWLKGATWLGKALNYTKNTNKAVQFAKVGAESFLQATIYSGMKYLGNKPEEKPDFNGFVNNYIQIVVGDMGRFLAGMGLDKIPISDTTKELFRYAADLTAGNLSVFAFGGDLDDYMKETLSRQAIAFGVVDMVLYLGSKGKLNVNRYTESVRNDMVDSLYRYLDNPTPKNLDDLAVKVDNYIEVAKPPKATVEELKGTIKDLNNMLTKDFETKITEYKQIPELTKAEPEKIPEEANATKTEPEAPKDSLELTKAKNSNTTVVKGEKVPGDIEVEFKSRMAKELFDFGASAHNGVFNKFQEQAIAKKFIDDLGLHRFTTPEKLVENLKKVIDDLDTTKDIKQVEPNKYKVSLSLEDLLSDVLGEGFKAYSDSVFTPKPLPQPEEPTVKTKVTPEELLKETEKVIKQGETITSKTPEELKPPEAGINITRLSTDPKTQQLLYDISKKIQQDVPHKTLEGIKQEAEKLSKDIGISIEEAQKLVAATKDAPEALTYYRQLAVKLGEEVTSIAERIVDGTASDIEKAQFIYKVEALHALTSNIQNLWRNISNIMNSGRINVGGDYMWVGDLDPKDLPKSPDGVVLSEITNGMKFDLQLFAKKMLEAKDAAAKTKVAKEFSKQGLVRRIVTEYTSGNMLRNVATFLRNISAQTANLLFDTATTFSKAAINTFVRNPDGTSWGEAFARVHGMFKGFTEAFHKPILTRQELLKASLGSDRGYSVFDMLSLRLLDPRKYEQVMSGVNIASRSEAEGFKPTITSDLLKNIDPDKPLINNIAKILDWYAANHRLTSFGALDLGDRPFVQAYYEGAVLGEIVKLEPKAPKDVKQTLYNRTLNYRKAMQLAPKIAERLGTPLNPKDPSNPVRQELTKILGEDVFGYDNLDTIKQIDEQAVLEAQKGTWKDPVDSKTLRKIESLVNNSLVLKSIIPYFHTPTKIFEKWLKATPGANLFITKFREDLLGKNGFKAQEEAWATFTTGTLLYGLGAVLFADGVLVPEARDGDERQAMLEAGVVPNSIKVGDKYVSLTSLDPAPGMFFSVMAELGRAWAEYQEDQDPDKSEYDKLMEMSAKVLLGLSRNVLNKTWLTSIRQTIDALNGYGTGKLIDNFVDRFNPISSLEKLATDNKFWGLNPLYKDYLDGITDELGNTKPRLDKFGKKIVKYDKVLGNIVSEQKDSPVRIEQIRLGHYLDGLSKNVKGVELTDEQWYDMMIYFRDTVKAEEQMNKFVQSASYKNADDATKVRLLQTYWNTLKKQAQTYILSKPEVRKAYKDYLKNKYTQYETPVLNWLGGER